MGYNTTIGPPRRMEAYLKKLLNRKETIRFATDDPHSLAYRLREAIYASQFHEKYEEYYKLRDMYTFRDKGDHVLADYQRVFPVEAIEGEDEAPELEDIEPEDAPEYRPDDEGPTKMEVPEAESVMEVVNVAINRGEEYRELVFPNATLMAQHLERLHGFTESNDWKIISHGEDGVTLTREQVPDEITWTPDEE